LEEGDLILHSESFNAVYALMSGSVCVLLFEDLFLLPLSLALLELVEPAPLDDWSSEREDWLRESWLFFLYWEEASLRMGDKEPFFLDWEEASLRIVDKELFFLDWEEASLRTGDEEPFFLECEEASLRIGDKELFFLEWEEASLLIGDKELVFLEWEGASLRIGDEDFGNLVELATLSDWSSKRADWLLESCLVLLEWEEVSLRIGDKDFDE
jgi:catechol 2,3-dioxygenase-like lactoylglutathione lyase family enzyme